MCDDVVCLCCPEKRACVSLRRPEGEPTGHVRWEIQTFQRHQVHDQGGKVPGPDVRRQRRSTDRADSRLRGEGSWNIPCVYTFQDSPPDTGGFCVKSGRALKTRAEPKLTIHHEPDDAFKGLTTEVRPWPWCVHEQPFSCLCSGSTQKLTRTSLVDNQPTQKIRISFHGDLVVMVSLICATCFDLFGFLRNKSKFLKLSNAAGCFFFYCLLVSFFIRINLRIWDGPSWVVDPGF